MALSDSQITDCMKNNLKQHEPVTPFSQVWEMHTSKKGMVMGMKKRIAVPALAMVSLLLLLLAGFAYQKIVDKTDYDFVNDPAIIGKWEAVDAVEEMNQFEPGKQWFPGELYLTGLAFIKDGKTLVSFEGSQLAPMPINWTKGLVINKQDQTASKYFMKDMDGSTYMFMEWKSGDYTYQHRKPPYYVLKQVDQKDYSDFKPTLTEDKIDYPFVNDQAVLGKWQGVDFVKEMADYKPGVKSWRDELFLTEMNFANNGEISMLSPEKGKIFRSNTWTKGIVICPKEKTASHYVIKEINGDSYMFYEWKSGDYIYLGRKPYYYVLKKAD